VENDREFGDSVYGLISFRLILIGNYIILIFDTFVFVVEGNTAIFSHSKRAGGKVTAIFLYSKATCWPCVLIC